MPRSASGYDVEGNPYRIRDPHFAAYIEIWLVSAVVAVLLIRGYLRLTGYPQVGSGSLHIAHMLWGGLGMAIGFGMLVIFANHVWKPIAAVVAGAGFGTFIDELGKFITEDNDYFYQPTVALIYGVFVGLYLIARYLGQKREPTEADHLYYAVDGVQWAAIGKLDASRREHALAHLDASGNDSPLAGHIRAVLEAAELLDHDDHSRILAWRDRMARRYWSVVGNRWLERIVIGLFVFKGVQVLGSLAVGLATGSFTVDDGLSVAEWGAAISALAGGVLAAWGVVRLMQRARVAALHAFAGSILISLLFGQFFAFASEQFLAMGSLIVELSILGVLRFALTAEEERVHYEARPGPVS